MWARTDTLNEHAFLQNWPNKLTCKGVSSVCVYVLREGDRIIKMRANTELKEGH